MRPDSEQFDYRSLPLAERILLAQEILDSVVAESHGDLFTRGQLEEIDRRVAAADAGALVAEPWEAVHARLSARCQPAPS